MAGWLKMRLLAGAGGWLALAATPSIAQTAAPDPSPTIEELIVTGSRLPQPDALANSPIVQLDEQTIVRSGALTLETLLNTLPQVVPTYSSGANNPSAEGAAYVDLRGLGESRNLVLLDGRRIVGANASNSVDLNTIPPALVERVEIITGGASAVYGPDAVAGVVNVILKRRFEGLQLDARTLVSERGDGREHMASVVHGLDGPAASLVASLGWSRRDEIGKGARAFSAQAGGPSSFLPGGGYLPGLTLPSQAAVNQVFGGYGIAPGAVSVRGGIGGFGFNADGTLFATGAPGQAALDAQNYRGPIDEVAARFYPDIYSFNFEPFNKLILPLERVSGTLIGEARPTDRLRLFGHVLTTRYTAATALAPTPAPTEPNPLYPGLGVFAFTVPVSNPFIPPDLRRLLDSRAGDAPALAGAGPSEEFLYRLRTVALGARESRNEAEVVNLLAGVDIDLGGGRRVEAFASHGRYDREQVQDGLLAVRRFEQILDSPTGGTELCEGGFDPFGGALNETCREFLRARVSYATRVEQDNLMAAISGPLWRLPAGTVLGLAGVEHRRVRYRFTPPTDIAPGEVAGFFPRSAVSGAVRFADAFVELSAPLLAARPFAESLDLTLGYRRSEEAGARGSDSWKAELSWAVVDAFRLRGSVQRAVRAPDIFERFEPPTPGGGLAEDPCVPASPNRTPEVLALCQRQATALGFAPSVVDTLRQFTPDLATEQSGNPDLEAEKALTVTLGAVWRPGWRNRWLSDLAVTLDGYRVEVEDAIGYLDPQVLLDDCYNLRGGGNPGYDPLHPACGRILRSSVDFAIVQLGTPQTNQGRLEVSGLDLSVSAHADLAEVSGRPWLGKLHGRLLVSHLANFEEQPSPRAVPVDYAGTVAGAFPSYQSLPRWKGRLDLAWRTGPVEVTASGRFIDAMEHRLDRLDPADPATGVGSAWYWDLSGRWDFDERVRLRAGILNLFDREPELYAPATDANTDPSTYDVIGRRFWLGLTLRL